MSDGTMTGAAQPAGDRAAPGWTAHLGPLSGVVLAFVVSRMVFRHRGVRFDAGGLDRYWQFLDPVLLRDDLLESVLHLHAQPPLFNLFLGSVLKLFPGHETAAFALVYAVLGLTLAVSLYLLMAALGVGRTPSAVLAALFAVSPPAVLYENWLFYTHPLAVLLCLAALLLWRWLRAPRFGYALAFFTALAAMALTHGAFHLVWFLGLLGALLALDRRRRMALLGAACAPLLLIVLWQAKNLALFGTFGSNTWLGMNLARAATFLLPLEVREDLVRRNELSGLALVAPFSRLDAYEDLVPPAEPWGVAALDRAEKQSGATNFNHLRFIAIGARYREDALHVMRHYPATYASGLSLASMLYFLPASDFPFLQRNRSRIPGYDRLFGHVAFGQIRYHEDTTLRAMDRGRLSMVQKVLSMGLFVILGYAVALIRGGRLCWRELRRGPRDPAFTITLLFLGLNVLWVMLVGNAAEIGENNRFRFVTDPLCFALLAALLCGEGRRRRAGDPPRDAPGDLP